MEEQRKVLKLLFKDKMVYELKQGFRTPRIADRGTLCGTIAQGNEEMVRHIIQSSNFSIFKILREWEEILLLSEVNLSKISVA